MTRAQTTPTPTRVGPGPTTFSPGGIGESVRRPDGVPKVTGEFESVVRKEGRRAGVFDIVGFRLDVTLDGAPVATSRNTIVFPRRDR